MVNPPAGIQSLSQVLGETDGSQNLILESEKDKKCPEPMKLCTDNMDHRFIPCTTSSTMGILTNTPVLEKNVVSFSSQDCLTSTHSPKRNICGAHDSSIVVPSNVNGALNADRKVKTSLWSSRKILPSKVEAKYDVQRQEMFSSTMTVETILKEKTDHLTTKKQYHSTRKCDNAPPKLRRHNVTIQAGQSSVDSSPNLKGAFGIDHKQLVAAANLVHVAKRVASDSPFWSKMEVFFASMGLEDLDFLNKQMDGSVKSRELLSETFVDENATLGLKEIEADSKKHENDKTQVSIDSDPLFQGAQSLSRFDKVPSLAQRVLSALINEDEVEDLYNQDEGSTSFQCTNDTLDHGSLDVMAIDPNSCNGVLTEVELGVDLQAPYNCLLDEDSFNNHTPSNQCESSSSDSKEDSGSKFLSKLGTSDISSCSSQYQTLSLDDKILMELQSIGIPLDSMPCSPLVEKSVDQEIVELNAELEQQGITKTKILSQIDEAIQRESQVEKKNIEQLAMNLLLSMAYRKQMDSRSGNSSRKAANKEVEEKAKDFGNRTLDRYKEYESTGKSCFTEPGLKEVLFSPPCEKDMKSAVSKFRRTFSGGCHKKATRKYYPRDQAKSAASNAGKATSSGEVQTGDTSGSKVQSKHSSVGRVKRKRSLSELCNPHAGKAAETVNAKQGARKMGENGSAPTSSTTGIILPPSAERPRKKRRLEKKADKEVDHLSESESQLYEVTILADYPDIDNLMKTVIDVPVEQVPLSDAAAEAENEVGEANNDLTVLNIDDEDNMTESEYVGLAVPMDDLWDVQFFGHQ